MRASGLESFSARSCDGGFLITAAAADPDRFNDRAATLQQDSGENRDAAVRFAAWMPEKVSMHRAS
jgi:hypothetical protein